MDNAGSRWMRGVMLALLGLFFWSTPASAQQGTIAGVLVDAETGESLIGANVIVQGTSIGASTDLDGRYQFKVDPGSYTLLFSYIGYNDMTVANVAVASGEVARLDMQLSEEAVEVGEVVIEAALILNSEAGLLRNRQKAIAVSDAISAEAISRSGSGDAAGAMTKVTGASVVGGKYVYIRGLGERYSSTQLNGAELPSADPDKKAFQLDLFPSSLLENIVTTKTFTPDKPGSFSGGLVNVGTKSFPERFTFQLSASASYNTQTTFDDNVLGYESSSTDWLGFDDGMRDIPDILTDPGLRLPTEIEALRDPGQAALLDDASKAFNNVMTPSTRTAPVSRSLSIAVGNQVDLKGKPFGYTASFTWNQDYSAYAEGIVGRWELVGGQVADINALTALRYFGDPSSASNQVQGYDRKGSAEANWGGLLTLAYKPHARHEVSTTYMRTQSGISEARELAGFWRDLSGDATFETRVLGYKERSLNSIQFKGEHAFGFAVLDWRSSFAQNQQDEPDLRYFSNHFTVRERDGQTETIFQSPASLYPAPTRFFRNLEEDNMDLGLDVSVPFRQWSGLQSKVKVGASYLDIARTFRERRFEYEEGRGFSYGEFNGDEGAYFAAAGIIDSTSSGLPRFGNYISDASSPRSNYDGAQTVTAFYGMVELPLARRLKLVGGARFEMTDMETASGDTTLPAGILDNDDWLPSVNLVYEVRDNMNLRTAFTRTLARPTFRELAPYATFDFVGDFVFRGNSELKRTLITNYDLRWEWFLRPGEILAVSAFYKNFENPIERVIQTSTGNNSLSVQNVPEARVYGLEFEARKGLDVIAPALKNIQIGGNLSVVHSEVDIPEEELTVIRVADPDAATTRSLEGQSPFLGNVDFSYNSYERGTVVSLYYNVFGKRLITVSEGAAPDIFERSRTTLDLIISQQLKGGVRLKMAAKNLLDQEYKTSQHFKDVEYIYGQYRQGRTLSVSLSYSI